MSRLKLVCVSLFITTYLASLSWGVVAHALRVGLCGNTLSYFVVWDMFCGWSAWDQRTHFIAEGSSGEFYDVKEPWGQFHPFGNVGRIHYDHTNHLLTRHVAHVLSHNQHEPIERVFAVQEVWPKQYNLPPELYQEYFARENDKLPYFHVRAICSENGSPLQVYPSWFDQQSLKTVYDNPRLQKQAHQATSLYSTLYTPRANQSVPFSAYGGTGLSTN